MTAWIWRLLRWGFAAYFLYVGFRIAARVLGFRSGSIQQPSDAAQAFSNSLANSVFMYPALAACYIAGGLALLWPRTAPLGLAILGPPIAIIFLFHMTLTGQYLWGGGWTLAWLLLVWQHRQAYMPLWNYGAS